MKEVIKDIDNWLSNDEAVALATVIQTWGSAPRGVGAQMAIAADGKIAGSVSGGCVEGAVVEAGLDVLKSNQPQLLHFGVADETAWDVGLACGGTIDIFVRPLDKARYNFLRAAILNEQAIATATFVQGPSDRFGRELILREDGEIFGIAADDIETQALEAAHDLLANGQSSRRRVSQEKLESDNEIEYFINVILPSPTLIIVGGAHISIALTTLAHTVGYRTIVIDPRRTFGSEARFAHADQLITAWPEDAFKQIQVTRSTAVATLTHDPKIDDPALHIALPSKAFYIGALGSRRTQAKRSERLLNAGLNQAAVERLHAPIGLEIDAATPEEIALAIMAQIVAARNQHVKIASDDDTVQSLTPATAHR